MILYLLLNTDLHKMCRNQYSCSLELMLIDMHGYHTMDHIYIYIYITSLPSGIIIFYTKLCRQIEVRRLG